MKDGERIRHLSRYRLLDDEPMPALDRLTELTRMIFAVPMAAVTLVADDRQIFRSCCGFDLDENDLSSAFCSQTIDGDEVLVIRDAAAHPVFSSSPLVTGKEQVRFYAGAPIPLGPDLRAGALCVMDTIPRSFLADDCRMLSLLAAEVAERIHDHHRQFRLAREIEARRRQRRTLLKQKADLVQNENMLRQIVQIAKVGAWSVNLETAETFWSDEILQMLEIERTPGVEQRGEEFVHEEDRPQFAEALARCRETGERLETVVRIRTARDRLRWIRVTAEVSLDRLGRRIMQGTSQDITSQRQSEADLARLATIDGLTGLPNRNTFRRAVEHAVARKPDENLQALLLLDLDDFKDINDTLGHDAGDYLLHRMSRRLRHCVGSCDIIGRLGGDEFGMLLKKRKSEGEIAARASLVLEAATAPIEFRGHSLRVGASVGIAVRSEDADDAASLLKAADIALYAAKHGGGDRWAFYSPEIGDVVERRHRTIQEARSGIDRGEFDVVFQPIVNLRSGQIRGMEALIRWHHPTRGLLAPVGFADALQDIALGRLLSGTAARRAIEHFASWRADGVTVPSLGLNISIGQIRDPGFVENLLGMLRTHMVPAEALVLEITEGVLLGRGAESLMRRVRMLHDAGLGIALDDFGTGYANLSHLREMPVDTLKIDASFVQAMLTQSDDRTIVRGVIEMAHGLGKSVVAEGVENGEADALLKLMSCEFGQGYHYGRPMAGAEVPDFVRRHSRVGLLRAG